MNYFARDVESDRGEGVYLAVNTDYFPFVRIRVGSGAVNVKDWREAKRFANAIISACRDVAQEAGS